MRTFQENNPCNRKGARNGQMGKKRNFIPKQNTHDLLVGTLSIGIPSIMVLFGGVHVQLLGTLGLSIRFFIVWLFLL